MLRIKIVVGFLLMNLLVQGQNNQAIITYNLDYKDFSMSGNQIDSINKKKFQNYIQSIVKESKDVQFTLFINNNESLFKINRKLEKGDQRLGRLAATLAGSDGVVYVDLVTEKMLHETSSFGEDFLISSSIRGRKWTITNESKMIGDYLCYKATSLKINRTFMGTTKHPIEAWFTPEIPHNFGPSNYCGLPGLILEVTFQQVRIFASSIQLNPNEKISVKKPIRGKRVTRRELDVLEEKMALDYIKSKS